ncbi:MAG: hypothetical protein Q9203_000995, partial [Teloschistes exilis]
LTRPSTLQHDMAPAPLSKLLTRNTCDHSLTSYDIDHDDFCSPITECACDEPWFYPVLILGIILLCISTCCCVKALRPKPWKDGFLAHGFMEKTPGGEEEGWYGKG